MRRLYVIGAKLLAFASSSSLEGPSASRSHDGEALGSTELNQRQ